MGIRGTILVLYRNHYVVGSATLYVYTCVCVCVCVYECVYIYIYIYIWSGGSLGSIQGACARVVLVLRGCIWNAAPWVILHVAWS